MADTSVDFKVTLLDQRGSAITTVTLQADPAMTPFDNGMKLGRALYHHDLRRAAIDVIARAEAFGSQMLQGEEIVVRGGPQ